MYDGSAANKLITSEEMLWPRKVCGAWLMQNFK